MGALISETFVPGLPSLELTPDNYLITPQLSLPSDTAYLTWHIKTMVNWAASEMYSVLISTTEPTIPAFTSIFSESLNATHVNWTERLLNLNDYAGQNVYIAFLHHTPEPQYAIFLDDVSVYIPHAHDLEAISISGQLNPSVGVETNYTISIKNTGTQIASGYSVSLKSNNNILSSASGPSLEPNEISNISITWLPTQAGEMIIYGEINWSLDADTTNNETNSLSINVMPEGLVNIYLGNPSSTTYDSATPFSFGLENGVCQILYLAEDINTSGFITHIKYTFNGMGNITQLMPVKIYMGTTTLNSFPENDSWVPYSNFTLVYDGYLSVSNSGIMDLLIPLDTPYEYTGGNLVVMNHNVYTTYWKSGNRFLLTASPGSFRSLVYNSTSYVVNPPQGLPNGTRRNDFVNMTLLFSLSNLCSLSGVVTDYITGQPLADVVVSIEESVYTDTTNQDGLYSIFNVPSGLVTITATKQGYLDTILEDVVLVGNINNVIDISMHQTPLIEISGTVLGSDTNLGLADALVMLTGYENYSTTTNSSGIFSISNVYVNQVYTLNITRVGYNKHTQEIYVIDLNNIVLDPIVLAERLNLPNNLIASDFTNYMNLSWSAPLIGNEWFSHAGSDINMGVGTNTPATFTMVQRFNQEQLSNLGVQGAYLTKVSFVPMREANYSIRIFTGGSDNPLQPGTMIHEQPISNSLLTWQQWNDITLSDEIRIPDKEELWIGVHIITPTGQPAGVDFGPQLHGFGDVMFYQGHWIYMQSINTINNLPYNWLIKGYAEGIKHRTDGVPPSTVPANSVRHRTDGVSPSTVPANSVRHINGETPSVRWRSEIAATDNGETPFVQSSRQLTGYNIYRSTTANLNNESMWITIVQNHPETTYNDESWSSITSGDFRYIVKSVYTNDNLSPPIFSNIVSPNQTSRVTINISTDNELFAENAIIRLLNNNGNENYIYQTYSINNIAFFPSIWQGNYTLTINHNLYLPYTNSSVNIGQNPFTYDANILVLNTIFSEGFEGEVFPPSGWQTIDADGDDWNWDRVDWAPAFGNYMAISQSAYSIGTIWLPLSPDNYLITPRITLLDNAIVTLHFYLRCDPTAPFETISVMISDSTPTPDAFIAIFTETLSNETSLWSLRTIDLSPYAGKSFYLAWRHYDSFDMNIIALDGISIISSGGTLNTSTETIKPIETALIGNYPNPLTPPLLFRLI